MIKTNYKETMIILEKLMKGEFSISDYVFTSIEEKKNVLSKHLKIEEDNIVYDKNRNIFAVKNDSEEYNVLTEKESHIQALINMFYDIKENCLFVSVDTAAEVLNVSEDDVYSNLNVGDEVPDAVSSLNIVRYAEDKGMMNIINCIVSLTKEVSREDFLSCDYKEIKKDEYLIYMLNN